MKKKTVEELIYAAENVLNVAYDTGSYENPDTEETWPEILELIRAISKMRKELERKAK